MTKLYFYKSVNMAANPVYINPNNINIYTENNSNIWSGTSYWGNQIDMRIGGSNLLGSEARINEIAYWIENELFASIFDFNLSPSSLEFKLKKGIKGLLGGSDEILGSDYKDVLLGGAGSDDLWGASGNDLVNGGSGNDTINGGSGRDTAQFSSKNNRINLNSTKTQNTGDGRDRLISIENVNAGYGNDVVTGNKAANTLNGQNGNDRLYGAAGNDVINGGKGRDTAQFSSRSNRINLNTTKTQNTGDGRDRLISIENVNAGSGNDIITGNKAANTLNGEKGNDRLYGGGGNDLLIGGGGKDRVWGQGGRDTFRVQRGSGYTIIEDFNNGQDRIQLGSGSSGLQLKTRGDDMYLYQRGDLMAVVEDAAGDLNRRGNFLV